MSDCCACKNYEYCNDEDNDDNDEEYYQELRERHEDDLASRCTCGAWQFIKGIPAHVADCVCGAE
jgi:hypothetical protein